MATAYSNSTFQKHSVAQCATVHWLKGPAISDQHWLLLVPFLLPSSLCCSVADLGVCRGLPLLRDHQQFNEGTVHTPADVHSALPRLLAALPP